MAGLVRGYKGLVYPTSFTVTSSTATVSIGNPYQIEYTITPSNATNKIINWSSSDTAVATVDSKGIITAVSVGTCTVTGVYSYDGTTVTIAVTTIRVPVTGISLDKDYMEVEEGKFNWLHATLSPAQPSDTRIIWSSSDETVATVNQEGAVGYVYAGDCIITATTVDGGFSASCNVSCGVRVTGITLDKDSLVINPGKKSQLIATISPEEATNKNIIWTSSDATIATVDANGVVRYVGEGYATITATTSDGGFTDTCEVYCGIPPTSITLNQSTGYVWSGQTLQLTPIFNPETTTNKNVTWSSSNPSVATVDANGLVTYVTNGSTTITCTTIVGGKTATCNVQGVVPVTGVSLNQTSGSIGTGETISLVATITPSDATIKTVTWKSSNTSVATVSSSGVVSYVADGTATITCTTVQGGKTATCTVTCENVKPVSQTFSYTGADQSYTIPYTQCYKLEAWGGGSWDAKGGYASGVMCITKGTVLRIMVGAKGNNSGNRYGFGGASNYSNCYDGAGLSGIFTGSTAIAATDSSRALVIGGGAGSCSGRGNGGAGGGENGASGGTSGYGTQGGGGTQSGRQSGGNVGGAQFCGGNGSGSYGAGGGGGWYGGNGTAGDGSAWDDKGAGGGSGYVKSTMTSRTLTQGGGSAAQTHGSVKISSV